MAPVTSTDSHLLTNLLKRFNIERRASSSPSTVNGLIAAVVILSVIIAGYATYKGVRWYYYRNSSSFLHRRARGRRVSKRNSEDRQTIVPEISITDNNYAHFQALSSAKSNEFSPASTTQAFIPPSEGFKTPRLDWRPPALASWSRPGTSTNSPEATGRRGKDEEIALPDQSYLDMGKPKEPGSNIQLFGASRVKSKKKANNGAMVNGSSPLNVPPLRPSASSEDDSVHEKEAERMEAESLRGRRHGGVASPPLPPLPTSTPEPTSTTSHQRSKSKDAKSDGAQPASGPTPSRPTSRATAKGSRLTGISIASNKRVSAAPSPRVSSLYHSRTSSHSYTPASPGLPHPQIPPMPVLPAFLQQQNQQQSVDRSSSVRTVRSLNADSIASVRNNPAHHTAASSTLLHDSTVPPSVVSDNSAEDMSGTIHDPTKGVDGKAIPRTMVVTATFTPSLSDELPLTIGETVCMLEEYVDGWCFVQRVKVLVKDASKLNEPGKGGILVGVNGTIDPENTYTIPVEGDGNSGAVPRFCVSEWPLSIAAMLELIEQQDNEQEIDGLHVDVEPSDQTPRVIAPSTPPESQTVTVPPPARLAPPAQTLAPPFSPPSALRKLDARKGPNDLNIPTPSDVPDSKFSSWGSMLPTGTQMPGIYSTMQNNLNTPPPPPSSSILTPSIPTPRVAPPAFIPNSNQNQNLAPPTKSPRKETVSSNSTSTTGPSEEDTSRNQSPASHVPPGPPPTSPAANTPTEEDDGIKRVSKPPPAPRLSRFPPSPEEDASTRHYQARTQDQNVGGAPGAGAIGAPMHSPMNLPRASERTVTMPPLPRRPTITDPLPEVPSLPINNNQQSKYGLNNNPQWGSVAPSTALSSAMDTSLGTSMMGSSVGSKTPSTGRSMASISKRFTSFAGGPRERSGSSASLGGLNRPGLMDRKASGPGVVSFKALRTGSATANVAAVATGR